MSNTLLVLCTCPDDGVAAGLARALVAERLAACVNRLPLTASTYRWQGQVVEDAEVLLMAKTTVGRFDALATRIVELHPYSVPEVIALPIEQGLPAYLRWLAASVDPRETSG